MEAELNATIIPCYFTAKPAVYVCLCMSVCVSSITLVNPYRREAKGFHWWPMHFTSSILSNYTHWKNMVLKIVPLNRLLLCPYFIYFLPLSLFFFPLCVARPKSFAARDLSAHPSKKTHVERRRQETHTHTHTHTQTDLPTAFLPHLIKLILFSLGEKDRKI